MIYLDANFFIFALLDTTIKGEKARGFLKEIIEGKKEAITSVLALDEVMWVLIKNKKEQLVQQAIEDIYAIPHLSIKEVSSLIPIQAIKLMQPFHLKPRDAFHLAIMRQHNISIILSDDADFDKIPDIKRMKLE